MPPMKALRFLLLTAAILGALYGFGRFFVSELGSGGGRAAEPAGVLFEPPPGYRIQESESQSRADAARNLADLLAASPEESRLGLHFTSGRRELYWLVERPGTGRANLTELAASPSGTRLATTWPGSTEQLDRRLEWAAAHGGDLEAPGLPAGEEKNLYH